MMPSLPAAAPDLARRRMAWEEELEAIDAELAACPEPAEVACPEPVEAADREADQAAEFELGEFS